MKQTSIFLTKEGFIMKKILIFAIIMSILVWIASRFFPEKFENIRQRYIAWKEDIFSVDKPLEKAMKEEEEFGERQREFMEEQRVRQKRY